ncbi:MAG: autotransporter domain-containing protein [Lysobacterales bacterium]
MTNFAILPSTGGRTATLCASLTLLTAVCTSQAQTIGELAVFGDNVADPGNIPALLEAGNAAGLGPVDTNFPPSPPYFGNRYSNGPVAAERLGGIEGIEAGSVTNLAVGNAFSAQLPVSLAGGALIGNGSSIPGPIGRGLAALNNTDVTSQIGQYLSARPTLNADDLMLIYMSANDAALALNTIALTGLSGAEAQALIIQGATANARNTVAAAAQLTAAGAQQIVLANLPDIGATPAAAAGGLAGITAAAGFTQVANGALATAASQLATDSGAVVTVFDSFSLLNDITSNPGKYGLSNVTDPCLAVLSCVGDPAQADAFLFWDAFFPTATVQGIAAAALADTVNAPKTLAAQGEVSRYAAEKFVLTMIEQGSVAEHAADASPGWRITAGVERLDWQRDGEVFAFGYDATIDRLNLAAHYHGENLTAALVLSRDSGDVDHRGLSSGFDFDSTRLGLYLGRQTDVWEMALALSFGDDELDNIQRRTGVAGQIARADGDADSLALLLQLRRHWQLDALRVSPTLRLGYSDSDLDEYSESGAVAMDQRVSSRRSTASFAEVGVGLNSRWFGDSQGLQVRPYGSLFYRAELGSDEQQINSRLVTVQEVTRSFAIAAPDSDYWRLALGLQAATQSGWHFTLDGALEEGADELDGFRVGVSVGYQW